MCFEKIARALPTFKPTWDARKGAMQLLAAYRQADLKVEEFEGPRYQRISHIRMLLQKHAIDDKLRVLAQAA